MSQDNDDALVAESIDMNDDDNDESSSGSSDMDEVQEEVLQLSQQVSFNPSYENYEKYIAVLRSAMMVEELRQAREDMASRFPLDKSIWIQWIDDEIRISSKPNDVIKLFERAVQDFLSIDIFLRYVEYVSSQIKDRDQVTSLFEKAISSCGAHFTEGSALWEMYRKYEYDPDRQKKLYIRQLGIPLLQMDDIMEEYKKWYQSTFNSSSPEVASFAKAHSVYNRLLPYEAKLLEADHIDLSVWTTYISSELSEGHVHVNRVTCLFERAISVLFNSESLWQKYIRFLRMHCSRNAQESLALVACRRAIRNCPWAVSLWCEWIITSTANDTSLESARLIFDEAMNQSFPTSDDYIRIVLEMCYSRARLVDLESDPETIRMLFRRAVEFDQYSQEASPFTDTVFTLYRYWAEVELHLLNNVESARECWSTILKKAGKQPQFWLQYFRFEQEIGDIDKCRSAFRRGIHIFQHDENLETISSAWIRFETEHGSLETRDEASFKASLLLDNQYLKRSEKGERASIPTKRKLESSNHSDNITKKSKHKAAVETAKNPKLSVVKPDAIFTAFVLNVDHKVSEKVLEQLFSPFGQVIQVRIPRDVRGRTRGFAYIDFAQSESVEAAISALNRSELYGRFISVEAFKENAARKTPRKILFDPTEASGGPESNIIFVKGFDRSSSQADAEKALRSRFEKYGNISSVRVPTESRTGKLKGIGYIEFETDSESAAALVENEFTMNGCKVSVAISNPPGKDNNKFLKRDLSGSKESKLAVFHPRGFAIPQAPVDRTRKPVLNVAQAQSNDAILEESVGKSNADFRNMFLKKR